MPTKLFDFTPADVAGHYWVDVKLVNPTQQEKMLQMQLAQAFRAPGADGKPQMSRLDIAREILQDPHPEETILRADLEWLEQTDPEIQGMRLAALRASWKKANAATVKAAEKELNPDPDEEFEKLKASLTPETLQQLIQAKAEAMHLEMMGGPPEAQQVQMAQQAAATPQPPPSTLPYQENGPSPEVLPSQQGMQAAPQGMAADPALIASQMRRGRPQP